MKTENTIENQRSFNELYWGQKVWRHKAWSNTRENYYVGSIEMESASLGYLELTPLSKISDEEACQLVDIFSQSEYNGAIKQKIKYGKSFTEQIQYQSDSWMAVSVASILKCIRWLESKGYYTGDGTEVQYGWVKLKTN